MPSLFREKAGEKNQRVGVRSFLEIFTKGGVLHIKNDIYFCLLFFIEF